MGLEIPAEADREQHVEVVVHGAMRDAWNTAEVIQSLSDWRPPSGGHRIGLAFPCTSPDEVDSTHDELINDGHRSHVEPFDRLLAQRYATVLDPDGTPVDLFALLG